MSKFLLFFVHEDGNIGKTFFASCKSESIAISRMKKMIEKEELGKEDKVAVVEIKNIKKFINLKEQPITISI